MKYIVELDKGVFLAGGQGSPPKTEKQSNAQHYKTKQVAKAQLTRVTRYYPSQNFDNSRIIEVSS